jgi:peptidoglycan/LPS O-acetylase OafA/YrhL
MDAKDRLDALAGLRLVAATAVALAHMPFLAGPRYGPTFARLTHEGCWALTLFFILSGFVLAYGYHDRLANPTRRELRRYYVARVARIWPLHLLTLGLAAAWAVSPARPGFGPLAANAFLVHAWVPDLRYVQSYNSVSWSLSLEWSFYLAFPLMVLAAARFPAARPRHLVPVAVVCWAVPAAAVGCFTHRTDTWVLFLCNASPPARVGEFAIGVTLGLAHVRSPRPSPGRWGTAVQLFAVLGLGVLIFHSHRVPVLLRLNGYYTPACALLVWAFARHRGALSRLVGSRPVVYLSELSLAFYLLHGIAFTLLNRAVGPGWNPLAQAALYLGATCAAAAVLHHAFEKPLRSAIIRWGDRPPAPRRTIWFARLRSRLRPATVNRHVSVHHS